MKKGTWFDHERKTGGGTLDLVMAHTEAQTRSDALKWMRKEFKIIEGETFKPGLREVIVGEATAKRYPTAKIGNELAFGAGTWKVVGVFSVGDSAANSETPFNDRSSVHGSVG